MKTVSLIGLCILLMTCSRDHSTVSTGWQDRDNYLRTSILGEWKLADYSYVTFYEDGTFKDSSYSYNSIDGRYLSKVGHGEYQILNSVLSFGTFYYSYFNPGPMVDRVFTKKPDCLIEIVGDTLNRTTINILTSDPNPASRFNQRWRYQDWMVAYENQIQMPPKLIYKGPVEIYYDFDDSSKTFINGWTYLEDTTLEDFKLEPKGFIYNEPVLVLDGGHPISVTFFDNGTMRWLQSENTQKWLRVVTRRRKARI